jgi:hypothetical protein
MGNILWGSTAGIATSSWLYTMLPVITLWVLFWKGWALWLASKKNQKIWFVVLLVVNLMGILEILYIFIFSKKTLKAAKKTFTAEEAKEVGDKLGMDWTKFDLAQFRRGMDVELEHGSVDEETNVSNDDPIITGKIALAHMNEFSDYYVRLDEMEEVAEKFWDSKKLATPVVTPVVEKVSEVKVEETTPITQPLSLEKKEEMKEEEVV